MVMRSFRDPILSETQDIEDQNTDAGKEQPYPVDPHGLYPETIDTDNPVGDIVLGDADSQHRELVALLANAAEAAQASLDDAGMVGFEIIRADAGLAPQSQHPKMRVRFIIISRATAGLATLGVGTALYPFTVAAAPVVIPFPLVIERGVDITFTGDGTIYLVGPTE